MLKNRWLTDGGGAVLGLGLMGCLCLAACLGFFDGCWVEAWPFPLFLVFAMVRVMEVVGKRLGVRVDFCGGEDEFGWVDDGKYDLGWWLGEFRRKR